MFAFGSSRAYHYCTAWCGACWYCYWRAAVPRLQYAYPTTAAQRLARAPPASKQANLSMRGGPIATPAAMTIHHALNLKKCAHDTTGSAW